MFYLLVEDLETRGRLIAHLKAAGIQAVFHYVPLHSSPMGQSFGYRKGMLPVTELISERLVRLPMYFSISDADLLQVVKQTYAFFGIQMTSEADRRAAS